MVEQERTTSSLKRRYFFKLAANVITMGVNGLTQAIVPRGLGPARYGDAQFLMNFFQQLVGFFDMGSSAAFYTKISQRPGETGIISFYTWVSLVVGLVSLGICLALLGAGLTPLIWPGQQGINVLLAVMVGILFWYSQTVGMLADALGMTTLMEKFRIVQKVLGLLLLLLLFGLSFLRLKSFLILQCFLSLVYSVVVFRQVYQSAFGGRITFKLPRESFVQYFREFFGFSYPLIVLSLAGLTAGLMDRWLLQFYAGSVQQGFFGLSAQISSLCFMFSSAMTPLIHREFAIAHQRQDVSAMAFLFRRYVPSLYALAAFFACFIVMNADSISIIMGGSGFGGARLAVSIMALFPMHQTYGQACGVIFMATGQTVLYRNVGLIFLSMGLPLTIFFVYPGSPVQLVLPGAAGLAAKAVLLQVFWVNVYLWFCAGAFRISRTKLLFHQVVNPVVLLLTAYGCKSLLAFLLPDTQSVLIQFLFSGISYCICVGIMAIIVPQLFGIQSKDFQAIMTKLRGMTETVGEWLFFR